jgi:hypothetical protein
VRRDEIVEVVEVKPVTAADVADGSDERPTAAPNPRPQPVRA